MLKIKIQYLALSDLIPDAKNARTHSERQVNEIAASITNFGFLNPVLIDKAGVIIAGHGRVLAAEILNLDKVPCVVLEHLNETQRKALALADNRIQQSSGWDVERLKDVLSELSEADFDLNITGFTQHELDTYLSIDEGFLPELTEFDSEPKSIPVQSRSDEEGEGRKIPDADEEAELEQVESVSKPKITDDDYSNFELVMVHENKVKLLEVLNDIKAEKQLSKLEDALMELVRRYES